MISLTQMRSLIERTLKDMGSRYASDDAIEMILVTGIVESRYKYITQLGSGPAKGFYQIEPKTCIDNLQHYLSHRKSLMKKCADASLVDLKYWQSYDESLWADILESSIRAGIVHCRLKYWRFPKRLPNTTEGKAKYWKKYYNTEGGKGQPKKWIEAVQKWMD